MSRMWTWVPQAEGKKKFLITHLNKPIYMAQ